MERRRRRKRKNKEIERTRKRRKLRIKEQDGKEDKREETKEKKRKVSRSHSVARLHAYWPLLYTCEHQHLIAWMQVDSGTASQSSLEFTESRPRERKHPARGDCVEEDALLASGVRGQRSEVVWTLWTLVLNQQHSASLLSTGLLRFYRHLACRTFSWTSRHRAQTIAIITKKKKKNLLENLQ